jgi:hypothetical protein
MDPGMLPGFSVRIAHCGLPHLPGRLRYNRPVMRDREIIFGALKGIRHRLWLRRALRDGFFGLCVVLYLLIALRMTGALLPVGIPTTGIPAWVPAAAGILAALGYLAWHLGRNVTLQQAAAHADTSAGLRDELMSAYWFLSHDERTPFIEAQVARAAVTASRLDARQLVPGRVPRTVHAALALGAMLAFVTWLSPRMTPLWDANAAPASTAAQGPDLRALLQGAPRDARIEALDRALEALQSDAATEAQKQQALETMREISEQTNMEALAARDGLARFAETVATNPQMANVAAALKAGNNAEALALLDELRAGLGPEGKDDETFPEGRAGGQSQGRLADDLDSAGRNLAGNTPQLSADAVSQAIRKVEEVTREMEIQNRVEQVKRGAKERMSTSAQRSAGKANAFGASNNLEAGNPTPAPENGNTDMAGGAMFKQGEANREEDADGAQEGARTGSAAGESDAMPVAGRATQRLDAQLRLEAIQKRDDAGEDANEDDKNWIYTGSQQQASALQYEEVRSRESFDREGAGRHDRIPVRQKQMVKNYFLNLHESEKK